MFDWIVSFHSRVYGIPPSNQISDKSDKRKTSFEREIIMSHVNHFEYLLEGILYYYFD